MTIRSVPALRLVVSLFGVQTVIFGALTVLIVDLALSELAAGPGASVCSTGCSAPAV